MSKNRSQKLINRSSMNDRVRLFSPVFVYVLHLCVYCIYTVVIEYIYIYVKYTTNTVLLLFFCGLISLIHKS